MHPRWRNQMSRLPRIILIVTLLAVAVAASAQSDTNACSLLSRAAIATATGLQVTKGKPGAPISGSLSNCTWQGSNGTKIVVTLADTSHMQVTMQSQLQSGATQLPGIGTSAVGTAGNAETEGGYNMSILDPKGGVAVSILGNAGTGDRTMALAKLIELHR
jgi:hypothetical protein